MTSLKLSGDFGDSIVSLAIAKQLGCDRLNIVDHRSLRSSFTARAKSVIPLMEYQSYISEVEVNGIGEDYDVTNMRRFHDRSQTLLQMQRKEIINISHWIPYDSSPWLTAPKNSYSPTRIVIARSERYRNLAFPWGEIVKRFSDRLLFVGHPAEHKDFESKFGWVEYYKTNDFLELAALINSADLFIGNQSSPNAIAQGLGKTSVLEVSEFICDCIYKRYNITYFTNQPIRIDGIEFSPIPAQCSNETRMLWMRSFANAGVIL